MKLFAKGFAWKVSWMVESDILWFAGGPIPLGEKARISVSGSPRQHMDGNSFISQLTGAKSQGWAKPTVKLTVMEIVRCAVNCTFKRFFSHEPVLKPSQGSGSLLAAEKAEPCTLCPNGYSANQSLDLEINLCSDKIVRERNAHRKLNSVFYCFLPAATV